MTFADFSRSTLYAHLLSKIINEKYFMFKCEEYASNSEYKNAICDAKAM